MNKSFVLSSRFAVWQNAPVIVYSLESRDHPLLRQNAGLNGLARPLWDQMHGWRDWSERVLYQVIHCLSTAKRHASVSQPHFHGWTLIIFRTPRNTYLWKRKQNKWSFGSARRLVQYCQLPDKNSSCISRHIWNFSRYVTICICLLYGFSLNL